MDNIEFDDTLFEDELDSIDIDEVMEDYEWDEVDEETVDEEVDTSDLDGMDGEDGMEDIDEEDSGEVQEEDYGIIKEDSGFISDTGDIVVMGNDENEDNFQLVYVDIENIAIVRRIRKNHNVGDLVRSIKSTGLLQPVMVAPTATEGLYVLLDGYRRLLACARAGKRRIPCNVNNKVSTPEIPVLEAMYNHRRQYNIKEIVDYIEYLEKQKGIMSGTMIEYLLQLNSGDYTKLKDILNDDDEEIVSKLFDGTYTIEQAFKKLEQRRRKESADEKELRKAEAVYGDEEESGADSIAGSGEEVEDGPGLTDEEISELAISPDSLDDGLEDASLDDMIEEGKEIDGFETKKQDVDNRERIDPALRKAVFARDNFTCQCCKRGGGSYVDVMEAHHIIPVFLNDGYSAEVAGDNLDNLITVCILCHRMVHLYSTGELQVPKEKSAEEIDEMTEEDRVIYEDEQMKFKRIVKLGTIIRRGIERKGIKLEQYKKANPSRNVGRQLPGYRTGISAAEAERGYQENKE